jgi:hypothetical protein
MGRVRVLRIAFALVLGLRLHLVCTLQGLPVAFALAGVKADERDVLGRHAHRRPGPGHHPARPDPHRR